MRSWSTLLALCLVACHGAVDTNDTDEPEDTDEPILPGEQGDTSATLSGKVVGPDGELDGANIRFCRGEQCRYATTANGGAFTFEKALVAWHSLEIVPPAGSGLATWFAPIELLKDQSRQLDITIPALDPLVALPDASAELELGQGLYVTLGKGDLVPPLFVDPATHASGVLVDTEHHPPLDSLEEVVAVWYTAPFDHHAKSDDGLPVRVKDAWGLAEGEVLEVWVGSYTDSAWLPAGTLTVGEDGWLTGDAALPLLSTVVLTRADAS